MTDTGLPANTKSESTILGAILWDNENLVDVGAKLSGDEFSLDSHRKIFTAMVAIAEAGRGIDDGTLAEELTRRKQLSDIGGLAYICGLTEGVYRGIALEEHVRIVKDKAIGRGVMSIAAGAIARAQDQSEPAIDVATATASAIETLLETGAVTDTSDVANATVEALEEFNRRARLTTSDTIGYGVFPELDAITGGMFPGEVTVIGGASGVGKSSVMVQSLISAGRASVPSVCYSLEMTRAQVLGKMWSIISGVPYRYIRYPHTARPDQLDAINRAALMVAEWPMDIYDRASMNLGEICASIKLHVRKRGAKLISLDYIQRMDVPGVQDERLKVSRGVMKLAQSVKGTQAHIQILSQLKRRDDDGFPRMKDLRESGQIENEAHCICLLWREYSEEEGDFKTNGKVLVPKNRFGLTGSVNSIFNRDYATYEAA